MAAKTYSSKPVLSSVKIGGTKYYLKDADARAILDGFGTAAEKDYDSEVKDGQTGLPTTAAVKSYVDAQVAAIEIGDVVIDEAKGGTGTDAKEPKTTASAATYKKIYLVQDADAAAGTYIEWLTIRSGSGTEADPYTYKWEQIGSTKLDLTGYLKDTATVAGVAFGTDQAITASELEAEDALNLKALSHKDSASGNVPSQDITGVTASYTPAGEVTLNAFTQTSTAATLTKGDLTVSGDVSGTALASGSITVTLKDSDAVTATLSTESYTPTGTVEAAATDGTFKALSSAAFQKSDAGVQITGTVSKPDITLTSAAATIVTGLTGGSAASFTEGTFTPASLGDGFYTAGKAATWTGATYTAATLGSASTDTFAKEGLLATVGADGGEDAECLIFSAATTSNAVTAQGAFTAGSVNFGSFDGGSATAIDTTKFNGGSKAADTFVANELQDVATSTINNVSAAALSAAPTFTGDKYNLNTTSDDALKNVVFTATNSANIVNKVEYVKSEIDTASFTGSNASLTFSKTISDAVVTAVNYDKATANGASFAGTTGTATVGTITVASTSVTVQ